MRSVQQRHAEFGLKALDGLRQCALPNVERSCGGTEAALLHDCAKHPELDQRHEKTLWNKCNARPVLCHAGGSDAFGLCKHSLPESQRVPLSSAAPLPRCFRQPEEASYAFVAFTGAARCNERV